MHPAVRPTLFVVLLVVLLDSPKPQQQLASSPLNLLVSVSKNLLAFSRLNLLVSKNLHPY